MRFAPVLLACAFASSGGMAQAPPPEPARPVLVNTGKPLRVPFQCTEEDISANGLACTAAEPCPVFLELSAADGAGNRIFLAGNLHTSTVTLYSVLLASQDLGKTWTEPYERIRSAALGEIQFYDFEIGWASGHILQNMPRDAFLLATTDGGKTWDRRPIFSEPRPGAVEHFWFDSRSNGRLWVDRMQVPGSGMRYEMYETMSGGSSWTLREVSAAPIPVKRAQGAAAERQWRLRPDAATRAFLLERQQGGRWSTVASFLVSIGECKAAEEPLREPPAEAEPQEAPVSPAPSPEPAKPRVPPTLRKKPN